MSTADYNANIGSPISRLEDDHFVYISTHAMPQRARRGHDSISRRLERNAHGQHQRRKRPQGALGRSENGSESNTMQQQRFTAPMVTVMDRKEEGYPETWL